MNRSEIIQITKENIAAEFSLEVSGHDWFHIDRVRKIALKIGNEEGGDLFIIEMAALLHDLDDWKFAGNDANKLPKARKLLREFNLDSENSEKILNVIQEVSFKGAHVQTKVNSIEAAAVQDADRLDAIGAIGIARTFAYGGHSGRLLYDTEIRPAVHEDFQSYKSSMAPTINHFYEKLLLLKDLMNTRSGKLMATERHDYMKKYLEQFFEEWEGTK
jgi:uncharacterized protein